jgi:hemerythrin-like domain-containing protein
MSERVNQPRRRDLILSAGAGAALLVVGCSKNKHSGPSASKKARDVKVSANEDLMREHGLIERILLIYEDAAGRLDANRELPIKTLAATAGIVRSFVEDYHQKLEEDYVFPKLERLPEHAGLVATLRAQHAAGRRLTDTILQLASKTALASEGSKAGLTDALREYIRMYRPHSAREDTVALPAFHAEVSPQEYKALGKQFEQTERQMFGKSGFENMVDSVAKLERDLGIHDLAQFTPKTTP